MRKGILLIAMIVSLLMSPIALALNPINGFYVGVRGSVTRSSQQFHQRFYPPYPYAGDVVVFPKNPNINYFDGIVYNSMLGGGGGGMLGFRFKTFRVEGEGYYNFTSADSLLVNHCRLVSPAIFTPVPTSTCQEDAKSVNNPDFTTNRVGFNGNTTGLYGMVNGYYDFINYEDDRDRSFVPYVGLGVGMVRLKDRFSFINTANVPTNRPSFGVTNKTSSGAAQFIIGGSYFLDDYTWIGMDYRYLASGTIRDELNGNHRYLLNMLNFNINFSFDNDWFQ